MKKSDQVFATVATLLNLILMTAAVAKNSPIDNTAHNVTRYEAKTFYETTTYQLAQARAWSYDQKELLINSDASSITNVYALSVADGSRRALTSSTTQPIYAISWFPHDDRALLQADQSGNEMTHIFVREASGELRDVTPGEKTKADFVGWAADGASFFVLTNERDPKAFDVYRIDAKTYKKGLVYRNDALLEVAAVSRQGRYVAGLKHSSNVDSDIYVADLQGANSEAKLITRHEGPTSFGVYEFTPEGDKLVYSTNGNGEYDQAWTYDLKSQKTAPLLQANWDVAFVTYSESGNFRVTGLNQDARTTIQITDRKGREVKLPGLPDGDVSRLRASPDDSKVALLLSSDTSPNDVYVVDLKNRKSLRLTHALSAHVNEADLVASQGVRYRSFDGLEIPSILYRPKGATKSAPVPALVLVHGGPGGQSRTGYSPDVQFFVNHGYAVIAPNNRGSVGYGKTFFHLDDRQHGEGDLQDVVYAKRYLSGLDWVDSERVGVVGGSYGGYMVCAALAFEPATFAVGIDFFGVVNWVRAIQNMPVWWGAARQYWLDEMGDPAKDPQQLQNRSPLLYAKNIRVPLLVIQGAHDPRVLPADSEEIVAAVKANGVPAELVVYQDEGHGFRKRDNRIDALERYDRFLDQYLLKSVH